MTELLSLDALLCGDVDRLRFISRFSTCNVIHKESVAEHSFYVAFYALQIGHWVTTVSIDRSVRFDVLLGRALVHDIDESRTGDFYRPFKYSSDTLREHLEHAAGLEVKGIFERLWEDSVPRSLMHAHWLFAKSADTEGCILAFADFLAVLSYMWTEVKVANHTMREHKESMRAYIQTFYAPKFEFLTPLVAEAEAILEEILR